MNHPNLNELAQRIHTQNKAAGWWDKPRPRVQTAWLIITELAEATEAERAGRYADLDAMARMGKLTNNWNWVTPMEWDDAFRKYIKDTFEDEIADAVIRLLDFAASEGLEVKIKNAPYWDDYQNEDCFWDVSDELYQGLRDPSDQPMMSYHICVAVSNLINLSKLRGFDLWKHIELKLKYNQTRGKMHGGKKF